MTKRRLVTSAEAKPCDHQPQLPCSDCPWARTALRGWLGGTSVEEWIQTAHGDGQINCHALRGPQCAGAAIYRANVCKSPRDPELLRLPANRELVFANPQQFTDHHAKPSLEP